MDIARDELRRQLREIDQTNTAVMPRWRDLLERVFSGDVALSVPERAELLGVPGRRQFLRVGGAAFAGATLLAACNDDESDVDGTAPTDTETDSTVDRSPAGDGDIDVVLANTALSLEVLVVDAYTIVIDSGLVERAVIGEVATLFREHHQAHADALFALVQSSGATPFTTANPLVKSQLVDPAVAAAASEADLIEMVLDLETAAAQTYVFAATALSTPDLRSTIMTIGGVENRHAAILGRLADEELETIFPGAVHPSENPLSDDALVTGR